MKDYEFGTKIYELRKAECLSQNKLAEMLGVSNKAVSKWENGNAKPSIEQLLKLAKIFNVSVEDLVETKKKEIKDRLLADIHGAVASGEKLEDVLYIKKLEQGSSVTRELILVKIRAKDTERQAVMNVTEIFHGKIVDVTHDSMMIELVGHQNKLDGFLDLLTGYEILELARTGITGLTRGSQDVRFLD